MGTPSGRDRTSTLLLSDLHTTGTQSLDSVRLSCLLIDRGHRPESIKSLKVYRADRTEIERDPAEHYLRPPELEKNFLISPPGSPPIGWEQVREDPPNVTPLAEDLINALRKLEIEAQFQRTKVEGQRGLELLLAPEDSTDGISVYVENCDIAEDEDEITIDIEETGEGWAYGEDSRYRMPAPKFVPTALPPPLVS